MKDQDQNMNASGRCALLPTYIAVALLIFIFCVVVFSLEDTRALLCSGAEKGQSCIKKFILDFQTLITGIFAVIAAYATVQAMLHTDSKAERRHRQAMALALRGELRTIERGLYPNIDLLYAELETIKRFDFSVERFSEKQSPKWSFFTEASFTLCRPLEKTLGILGNDSFVDAEKFFDGMLVHILNDFRTVDGLLLKMMELHRDTFDPELTEPGDQYRYEYEIWDEREEHAYRLTTQLPDRLEKLINQLERFSRESQSFFERYSE